MHPSFCKDDFREFVDTLVVALREMEKSESPLAHIHPVIVKDNSSSQVEDTTKHQALRPKV